MLDRKLVRDLAQMKGQALAIALVIACGVATFVMSLCTYASLRGALDTYYERYRFAQAFAHLKRAPSSVAERLRAIPGVAWVEPRIVQHVTLDVPGLAEPAVGRLISIPDRPRAGLNERFIRAGRSIGPGREGEVLVGEAFAIAHGFRPGDSVSAIINGRKRALRIVGVALSPEFIYQIRDGDILPDDRRFGVFWMGESELAAAFDMTGAFNDAALALTPDAVEAEVLLRLDRELAPYGGLGAHGRADQSSHKFISNELNELKGMATVVPTVFLAVAAFLLNLVVTRLVSTQREQVAALKAFGYTGREVGVHYLKLVLLIAGVGVVLGAILGARLGLAITELYTRFFRFPIFAFRLDPAVLAQAIGLSAAVAVLGTLSAVGRAVRLPPAEAMRPEPPANYRPTIAERLGLQAVLSPVARMILRNLERRPVRSGLSALGIALAVAMLVLGNFMADAVDDVMTAQYQVAQRQDLTLSFVEPSGPRAIADVAHLPGVRAVEPFRALPARVRRGQASRRLGILGLDADATLFRVMDVHRREVRPPPEGLVMSETLGRVLGAGVGDAVTVEILEGRRPVKEMVVAGLVEDFAGVAAYIDRRAANRLMEEGPLASGAHVAAEPGRIDALYTTLKATPRVAGVTVKGAVLASFRETVAENLLRMRLFNVLFASVISCGVVYNCARIALAERSRELATLRVIGFTRGEISAILLGELGVLTFVAIPIGLAMGYGMAWAVIYKSYDTELFRMPLVVSHATFAFAAVVTLAAAGLSGLSVRRGLDRLDLVAVLKSKE